LHGVMSLVYVVGVSLTCEIVQWGFHANTSGILQQMLG
jgi:hypothetical protein